MANTLWRVMPAAKLSKRRRCERLGAPLRVNVAGEPTPECRVFLVGAASCQARARKHSLDQGQDIHGVVISELLGNEVFGVHACPRGVSDWRRRVAWSHPSGKESAVDPVSWAFSFLELLNNAETDRYWAARDTIDDARASAAQKTRAWEVIERMEHRHGREAARRPPARR